MLNPIYTEIDGNEFFEGVTDGGKYTILRATREGATYRFTGFFVYDESGTVFFRPITWLQDSKGRVIAGSPRYLGGPIRASLCMGSDHAAASLAVTPAAVPENASGYGLSHSRDGTTVVGFFDNGFSTPFHAFRWTESSDVEDLGTLDPANNATRSSYAHDVSNDGSVIVGFSSTSGLWEHAFRWTQAGGMVDPGTGDGVTTDRSSRAFALSADGGTIVGTSHFPGTGSIMRAFRHTQAGGFTDLGNDTREANAVSADGAVIVGGGRESAFR